MKRNKILACISENNLLRPKLHLVFVKQLPIKLLNQITICEK